MKKKVTLLGCVVLLLAFSSYTFVSYCIKVDDAYIPYPNFDDSVLFTFEEVVHNNLPKESCFQKYLDFYFDSGIDFLLHNNSRKSCRWESSKVTLYDKSGFTTIIDSYRDSVVAMVENGSSPKKIVSKKKEGLTTSISYREINNQENFKYNLFVNYSYDGSNLKEITFIDSSLNEDIFSQKIFLRKKFEINDSSKIEGYYSYFGEADFLRIFQDDIDIPWKIYEENATPVEGLLVWGKFKKEDLFFDCDNYVNCKKSSSVYENHSCKNPFASYCMSIEQKDRVLSKIASRNNKFFKQKILRQWFDSTLTYERYEVEQKGFWRHKRIVEITYDSITSLPLSRLYKEKMSLLGLLDFCNDELKEYITYQKDRFQRKDMFRNDSLIQSVIFKIDSVNRYTGIYVYGENGELNQKIDIKNH